MKKYKGRKEMSRKEGDVVDVMGGVERKWNEVRSMKERRGVGRRGEE